MFRSKVKQRRIFSNRRRVRRRFPWFGAIASLALLLLALELLTRIFVDLGGNRGQFTGSEGGSDITQAYQLDFVSPEQIAQSRSQGKFFASYQQSVCRLRISWRSH